MTLVLREDSGFWFCILCMLASVNHTNVQIFQSRFRLHAVGGHQMLLERDFCTGSLLLCMTCGVPHISCIVLYAYVGLLPCLLM